MLVLKLYCNCFLQENVAYLSHPFEVEMFYKPDEIEENEERLPQWPQIFVEVLSIDSWQRYRTEGYGYITIPSTPGKYKSVSILKYRQ